MRTLVAAAVLAVAATAASGAMAEETTVIKRTDGPAVSVERRDTIVERRDVTGSVDCGSKTIHKEDGMGNSKTIHKEGCN